MEGARLREVIRLCRESLFNFNFFVVHFQLYMIFFRYIRREDNNDGFDFKNGRRPFV
jgi:hypothetical protein